LVLAAGLILVSLGSAVAEPRRLATKEAVTSLVALPDGTAFLSAESKGTVRLWDLATGKEVHRFAAWSGMGISAAFAPDGKMMAIASGNGITLFDTQQRRETRVLVAAKKPKAAGDGDVGGGFLQPLSFSADGKRVRALRQDRLAALAGNGKAMLHTWEVATGNEVSQVDLPHAFAGELPDDKGVYCRAEDGTIHLCDSGTGKETSTFKLSSHDNTRDILLGGPGHVLFGVSPDGRSLFSARSVTTFFGGMDRGYYQLQVWAAGSGQEIYTTGRVNWSGGGPHFSSSPVAFSPDGRLAAISDPGKELQLWSLNRGKALGTRETPPPPMGRELPRHFRDAPPRHVCFAPDGRTLAIAGKGGSIALRELCTLSDRAEITTNAKGASVFAFVQGSRVLAAAGAEKDILLYDLAAVSGDAPPPPDAKGLERLWNELGDASAAKAWRAVQTLTAHPAQSLPVLQERLTALRLGDAGRIEMRIGNLNNPRFPVRQDAMEELERWKDLAEPALRRVLENKPSLEVRQRVEKLLARLDDTVQSVELLRIARAVEVFELLETRAAHQALAEIAEKTRDPWVTLYAKSAANRLGKRLGSRP